MADRVDETGAAYAGSQLQTQLYVNKRRSQLDAAIHVEFSDLADATLDWRSPLADDHYDEYWDGDFLRRLHLDAHVDALARFWAPTGGPHWDALALVALPGEQSRGVLLVEGKSYPNEMLNGSPAGASATASIHAIERALAWTQGILGIPLNISAWTGPLYQNANRLAHVYWLRSRGVRAWLVHLLFTGDPPHRTTVPEWKDAVKTADSRLGLTGVDVEPARHIMLPDGTRDELLS